MTKFDVKKMEADKANLQEQVTLFSNGFISLEIEMAKLLHNVLFFRDTYAQTRVAHAIYFSPDGFGGRLAIVNNAITEWLVENDMGTHDFKSLWERIYRRLDVLRKARNNIAHGRVEHLIFEKRGKEEMETRAVPPTYDHRFYRTLAKGNRPGKTLADMEKTNKALSLTQVAVMFLAQAVEDWEAGEPTWQTRYHELEERLRQLDSLFPAAPTAQGCSAQPQSSGG